MTWPNVREALRDYLKADAGVAALIGNRVFYGVPSGATFPLVTIPGQVGGGQDPGEAPLDRPLYQLDRWGRKPDGLPTLYALESAVRDALDALRNATVVGSAVLYGATLAGAVDFPDPADDRPRRILTVDITARALVA
jgi:hypothetical protein